MEPPPNRRFCSVPFRRMEVRGGGEAFVCCWVPEPIGNIATQPLEEVWNGAKARAIRESILDDSFKYCDADRCPFLRTVRHPVQLIPDVTDAELKTGIAENRTVVPHGPREIHCSFDRSCNLSCPSCRTETIVETDRRRIIEIQSKIDEEALEDAETLYLNMAGDAFGSPFSRDWLRSRKIEDLGSLRTICLFSNGQMWTPEAWKAIPADVRKLIRWAFISIDAASPELYALNRRGGRFETLLENLDFIGGLRRSGPLEEFAISMVVQENNFREMPAFVRLGRRFGADRVQFMKLSDWGTFPPEEFSARAVHRTSHPNFHELGRVLKDPVLREPGVDLGNLGWL